MREYGVSNYLIDKAIKSLEQVDNIHYKNDDYIDLLDKRVRLLVYLDS